MLRTRDERQELIDDPALPDEDFAAAMADLARVNFWLRGHAPTLSFLRRHAPRGGFSLLDVGAGQGHAVIADEACSAQGVRVVVAEVTEKIAELAERGVLQ